MPRDLAEPWRSFLAEKAVTAKVTARATDRPNHKGRQSMRELRSAPKAKAQ